MTTDISFSLNTDSQQKYKFFQEKQQYLLDRLQKLIQILEALDLFDRKKNLENYKITAATDVFRLMVFGEFKSGKSTLINALLRAEVLPSNFAPVTAFICEVKYGEMPRVLLRRLPDEDGNSEIQEIPVNELNQYVTIKNSSTSGSLPLDAAYEKADIYWPIKLCENGVEIIDSPGLNEQNDRQRISLEYSSKAHAILFVMSSEHLGPSLSEQNAIDVLHLANHKDIFFVFNKFDIIEPEDRDAFMVQARARFAKFTNRTPENGMFFTNAKGALRGYIRNDYQKIANSGIAILENELANFLTSESGRVKLGLLIDNIQDGIDKALGDIPVKRKMYTADIQVLENNYQKAQSSLLELESRRKAMIQRIDNFIKDLNVELREKIAEFFYDISKYHKILQWANDYTIQEPIKFKFELPPAQVGRVVEELSKYLNKSLEQEFYNWQQTTLTPYLDSRINKLERELDQDAKKFLSQVRRTQNIIITGIDADADEFDEGKVSALQRILSAAGGVLLGNAVLGVYGAVFGPKAMLKSLLPQFLLGFLAALIIDTNPVLLIPILIAELATGGAQAVLTLKAMNEKIKKTVAEKFETSFSDSIEKQSAKIATSFVEKMNEFMYSVDRGMLAEINGIRNQAEVAIKEKSEGEVSIEKKINELDNLEIQLSTMQQELMEFEV